MSNISQTSTAKYVLTAADIVNGFAAVPVRWRSPFFDTNYEFSWTIEDTTFGSPSLDYATGDAHNVAPEGFTAVVDISAAAPLIQGELDAINVTTGQSLSFVAPISTMYMVTIYVDSRGDAGTPSDELNYTQAWTDASGAQSTTTTGIIVRSGGNPSYAAQTSPVYCVAGATITTSTAFAGAYSFHYDYSVRIVQMPNNSVVPAAGETFVIHAMASHR